MYNLYVIELDEQVLAKRKFREANPGFRAGKPCVYVGSTYLTPEERFQQHREGYKANRYARDQGFRLLPRLYQKHQGFESRDVAEAAEARLAERLRKRGYGVWYGV